MMIVRNSKSFLRVSQRVRSFPEFPRVSQRVSVNKVVLL